MTEAVQPRSTFPSLSYLLSAALPLGAPVSETHQDELGQLQGEVGEEGQEADHVGADALGEEGEIRDRERVNICCCNGNPALKTRIIRGGVGGSATK